MQGLIRMTTAWLKRLDRLIKAAVAKTDSCVVQFQNFSSKFSVLPLRLVESNSIHRLLDGTPDFGSILGHYSLAHASEIVLDHETRSPAEGDPVGTEAYRVSGKLHSAMQNCIKRCLVRASTLPLACSCLTVHPVP